MHSCPVLYTGYPSPITIRSLFPGYAAAVHSPSSSYLSKYRPHKSYNSLRTCNIVELFCSSRRISNIKKIIDVASVSKVLLPLQKSMPNPSKSNLLQHVSNKETIIRFSFKVIGVWFNNSGGFYASYFNLKFNQSGTQFEEILARKSQTADLP